MIIFFNNHLKYKYFIISLQYKTDAFVYWAVVCQLSQIQCVVGGQEQMPFFKVLETLSQGNSHEKYHKTQNTFHGKFLEQPKQSQIEIEKEYI